LLGIEGVANHDMVYLDRSSVGYKIAEKLKAGQKLSNVRSGPRAVHTWEIPEVFGSTTRKEREVLEEVLRLRRRNRIRDFGDADPVETKLLKKLFGSSLIASLEAKSYLKRVGDSHDLVGTFNGKYRRLHLDEPSYTVDTRFGDPRYFLHPTENRGFTVREAARIQGFPDGFVFNGSKSEQFRMIGNAVPPPMATNFAQFLRSAFGL
jgi:DNA (cytosine-5)-methyltransferase 1